VGTQFTVLLIPDSGNGDPVSHFLDSVNDLFGQALQNVSYSDMLVITIQNQLNQNIGKIIYLEM